MFTGLIEEVGKIEKLQHESHGGFITVTARFSAELAEGESVAIDGVCLTVVSSESCRFTARVSDETWIRSKVSRVNVGDRVNLERALRVDARLGGHFVLGHVDAIGNLMTKSTEGRFAHLRFGYPLEYKAYLVDKGSIAIDGVSLTVTELSGSEFSVAVIPTTLESTTLGHMVAGVFVNLEFDVIGKYILRAMQVGYFNPKKELTQEKLLEWGYD